MYVTLNNYKKSNYMYILYIYIVAIPSTQQQITKTFYARHSLTTGGCSTRGGVSLTGRLAGPALACC